jgi:hypothetical protein
MISARYANAQPLKMLFIAIVPKQRPRWHALTLTSGNIA